MLDKVEEVSKSIINERIGIALSDESKIVAWESNRKLKSNSLITFYTAWCKMQAEKINRSVVDKIEVSFHHA